MKSRPVAVAFDVIGTIFSLETLRDRLRSAGLPRGGVPAELKHAGLIEITDSAEFREKLEPPRREQQSTPTAPTPRWNAQPLMSKTPAK